MKRTIIAVALLGSLVPPVWADLKWDNPVLEIKAKSTDVMVPAKYTFTNTGPDPVTFTRIEASCECLRAKPEKKTVAAGEKGSIDVAFYVEGRSGNYEQTITVETEDEEPVTFKVKMEVTGKGIDPGNFVRPAPAPPRDRYPAAPAK